MSLQDRIETACRQAEGRHYTNAPTRGHALLLTLLGEVKVLNDSPSDDPLLFACRCLDSLPKIAGLVIALEKWCVAVNDATPDQIQETGALVCR